MVKYIATSVLVAVLAPTIWLGRTILIEELRHPLVFRYLGVDPAINTAALSTETALPCAATEVIFARGTTEPSPLGYVLGPRFKQALEQHISADLNELLVVGLDYLATFRLPRSLEQGVERLAERVKRRAKQCPNTGFVLSGYSQGADVVHSGLNELVEERDRIKAIVTFGLPFVWIGFPPYYAGRVLNVCNNGDRGCGGKRLGLGHFRYGRNGTYYHEAAAKWMARKVEEEMTFPSVAATVDAPPVGSINGLFRPWKEWPPKEWATQYASGFMPPTIGFLGETMEDLNIDRV